MDELLPKLGYLGRAESWVEARRATEEIPPESLCCIPGDQPVDRKTGEVEHEVISLFNPIPGKDYAQWRKSFVSDELPALKGVAKKHMAKTVPETLSAALSLDTSDLQKVGWSRPPASEPVHYLRSLDSLCPKREFSRVIRETSRPPTTARFILIGKPLPRNEDALRIGEWFRNGLTGKAKRLFGEDCIPNELSGHDLPENNRHGHAFYLPEDADGDGLIDHIVVHAPMGFSLQARRVLEHLTILWERKGHKQGMEYRVVLEALGLSDQFVNASTLFGEGREWTSITPYLNPWHFKRNRPLDLQILKFIQRELCLRETGNPNLISVELLPHIEIHGKQRRTLHFHRSRNKRGLTQPDTRGHLLQLHFEKPVQGPLALGFGCHFGLGLFKPVKE